MSPFLVVAESLEESLPIKSPDLPIERKSKAKPSPHMLRSVARAGYFILRPSLIARALKPPTLPPCTHPTKNYHRRAEAYKESECDLAVLRACFCGKSVVSYTHLRKRGVPEMENTHSHTANFYTPLRFEVWESTDPRTEEQYTEQAVRYISRDMNKAQEWAAYNQSELNKLDVDIADLEAKLKELYEARERHTMSLKYWLGRLEELPNEMNWQSPARICYRKEYIEPNIDELMPF